MSLTLITGIPGAGKTLFAVSMLKKEIEKNMSLPADEQIKIYCDITGLKITDIEQPPIDWQTTPPKSLLIYDEAQFHKEFKPARGVSPYPFIENLTIHRKTGHHIWYITQDPKRLHSNILEMVEKHYHLERPYGAKLATIYQFRGAERTPKSRSAKDRAERQLLFNYDKSLFDLYESSQVEDGIKLRLPKQILFWIGILLVIVYFIIKMVFFNDTNKQLVNKLQGKPEPSSQQSSSLLDMSPSNTSDNLLSTLQQQSSQSNQSTNQLSQQSIESVQQLLISAQQYQQAEQVRPAMVIVSENNCSVTNAYGQRLDLTSEQCQQIANKPLQISYLRRIKPKPMMNNNKNITNSLGTQL